MSLRHPVHVNIISFFFFSRSFVMRAYSSDNPLLWCAETVYSYISEHNSYVYECVSVRVYVCEFVQSL